MISIPLFDTHQHLLMTDRWPYSWARKFAPLANRRFGYEEYLEAAAGAGIGGALFMESTPDNAYWRDETYAALEMAADPDTLVRGVIANCRPESEEDFVAWVAHISTPGLVGFRRILHVEPDELSLQPAFIRSLRHLAEWNLTFDMCFLHSQLPFARKLALQCPDNLLILDHCGVPDIASGLLDPWRADIKALAELPHVHCKISGLAAYCAAGAFTVEAVRPYVEHCIECFGWDRVVWGGDWPVCLLNASLKSWADATREIVAREDESSQRKLFHENAERIYKVELGCSSKGLAG